MGEGGGKVACPEGQAIPGIHAKQDCERIRSKRTFCGAHQFVSGEIPCFKGARLEPENVCVEAPVAPNQAVVGGEHQANPSVAGVWHTVIVLAVMGIWIYAGLARTRYLVAHTEFGRIYLYLRLIAAECALTAFVIWGVHKSGNKLGSLLGERWRSAKDFFRDVGIAAAFWIIALILTGIVRISLPAPPVNAPAQSASSTPETGDMQKSPSVPSTDSGGAGDLPKPARSPRIPPILLRMAPHGRTEILVWLLLSLTAGFCEEIVFRGYLRMQFAAWLGMPFGILGSSVIFGLGHLYQGRNAAIAIGFYGILLALLAFNRKSLLPGIMSHSWQDILSGLLMGFLRR
jgi:membrane protease YdiL (CAAX protease family)